MLSLKLRAKMLNYSDATMQTAYEVARKPNKAPDSPFSKLIRFDSPNDRAVGKLPVTTLAARGSSDLATSLVGLAKVAGENAEPERLASTMTAAVQAVKDQFASLLEEGMPLALPENDGTKGSATMLVGLGVCLAFRMKALGRELPEQDDLLPGEGCRAGLQREDSGQLLRTDQRATGRVRRSFPG